MGEIITKTIERKFVPLDEVGELRVTKAMAAKYFKRNVSRIDKLVDRGHIRRYKDGIPIRDLYSCDQEIARGYGKVPFKQ